MPVTRRAVALGLLLIPLNAWWITQIEYVRYSDNATTSALFFNAVGMLVLLSVLNAVVQRVVPRWAFSRAELLTVYVIVVIASCLAGHDQLQILFTTLTWVFRHATPENSWETVIWPLLPKSVLVTSPTAIDRLYLGGASLYDPQVLLAWWKPLAWWCSYAFVVAWTLLSLSAILRKQWESERLNYPITEVPLEITAPGRRLIRTPVFWVAAMSAASLQFLNLCHTLWPSIPGIAVGVKYYQLKGAPWTAAGSIPFSSFPFAYGLAYLLPLQLSFSVWFFMLLARVEMVATYAVGYTEWGKFPYIQQQGFGAYLGIAAFVLWAARRHLQEVWLHAIGKAQGGDEGEPMRYSVALWGFAAGVGALLFFSMQMGMRLSTALVYLPILLSTIMTVARLRAELGLPTIELYQVGVDDMLQRVLGARAFAKRDLVVMTLNFYLTRTHRQLPMQTYVDAFRIADRAPMSKRDLAKALTAATGVAIVAAFWAYLHVVYKTGFESAKFRGPAGWAFGDEPWRKLRSWLLTPRDADYASTIAYVFGFAFTLFLASMRTRFLWWPFHPVGYLVSGSFGLFRLWFPIFVTWLIKTIILRYGGLDWYRKARPFFFGLIIGEFCAALARTLIDLAFSLYLPPESGVGGL
jgi:Family of unknown function (DUF6785)/Domain of unknown function (DUF6784)